MDFPTPPPSEEPGLKEILERTGPKLRQVLFRYRIPLRDADDLLEETFMVLVSKWGSLQDPEAWLQTTLVHRCIQYWSRRSSRIWDLADRTILDLLGGDASLSSGETAAVRSDLEALLSQLPARCQEILRQRYGLDGTPPEPGTPPSGATRRCLAILARRALGGLSRPPNG